MYFINEVIDDSNQVRKKVKINHLKRKCIQMEKFCIIFSPRKVQPDHIVVISILIINSSDNTIVNIVDSNKGYNY